MRWHCWAKDLPQFTSAWGHGLWYLCPVLLPRVIFSWTTQKQATNHSITHPPLEKLVGVTKGELLRGARKNLVVSRKRLYSALILLFIGNTLWRRIIYLVYSFKVVLMINFKEAKNTVENNNLTNKQNSEWYKNNRSRTRAVFPHAALEEAEMYCIFEPNGSTHLDAKGNRN